MTNELAIRYPTGSTLYAHVLDATGQVWNGAGWEAPQNANWLNYDLAMAEAGTTGYYRVSMPAVAAGSYSFLVFLQAGGGPVVGDTCIGEGFIQWDGSDEVPTSSILTDIGALNNLSQADILSDATPFAGANISNLDAASSTLATSAALATVDGNVDAILADTGTDGVKLAADAITASTFDESTAFPLTASDTGSTYVARTGADSDTLETLSDQADLQATAVALATAQVDLDNPAQYMANVAALAIEANVQGHAADALTAYDPPTKAELDTAESNIRGADSDDLKDISDEIATITVDNAAIADAVWDELATGHTDAGKAGQQIWTDVDAIKVVTDNLPDAGALTTIQADLDNPAQYMADVSALATSVEIAALNDVSIAEMQAMIIEGALTLQQVLRIMLAFAAGTTTGANTTNPIFKSRDGLTDRIDMTVDSDGERSVVTVDGS